MIKKKVCMLGAFAVGKTSLVRRYVHGLFDERYQTTVGVKVDRKAVPVDGREVNLFLWDIHGEDDLQKVRPSTLRGASGVLLVADGTRRPTLHTAEQLQQLAAEATGRELPFLLLVNKVDLRRDWEIGDADLEELRGRGWTVLETSAKTGEVVEEAFETLARRMVEP